VINPHQRQILAKNTPTGNYVPSVQNPRNVLTLMLLHALRTDGTLNHFYFFYQYFAPKGACFNIYTLFLILR
jgi:hypothetical protein